VRNAPAYDVRAVSKIYSTPHVVANDGISFTAASGEAFGLLGPNGAGKTTLVRQMVGLLAPTAGEIRLFGESVDARRPPGSIGRTVAYLPQSALALGELRVEEALRWTAMIRGLGERAAGAEAAELVGALELDGFEDRQIRRLSVGQRRLVHIGMALCGRPPVLILDEPTADIDPALRRRVWSLISTRVRSGACVILVTHDVAEAEHVLDRVAILRAGRIVALGTPAELKASLAHRTRIELRVAAAAPMDPDVVAADIDGETHVSGRVVSAWVPAELAVTVLEKVIASAGLDGFEDVRLITPTLEDVYLELGDRSTGSPP
jgi:ABC-type multidrug transport system ATPase subunit